MQQSTPDFRAILTCLATHRVEFIVVGGVGAVLQGAPIATFDLDIVHERSSENVTRLLAALGELDAIFRDPAGRRIRPQAHHLLGEGQCLLLTNAGPLDVLGEIGNMLRFEVLVDASQQVLAIETPVERDFADEAGRVQARIHSSFAEAGVRHESFLCAALLGVKAKAFDDGLDVGPLVTV